MSCLGPCSPYRNLDQVRSAERKGTVVPSPYTDEPEWWPAAKPSPSGHPEDWAGHMDAGTQEVALGEVPPDDLNPAFPPDDLGAPLCLGWGPGFF